MAATERLALALALLSPACAWSDPLTSDPSAWSPPRTVEKGGDAQGTVDPRCSDLPVGDSAVTSSANSLSHEHGQPCLEGCHESGGSAKTAFEIAGSAFASQSSRLPATPGLSLSGLGGETLTVDRCGNFYAIRAALPASARATQPFTLEPTFRKMEKSMQLIKVPGSCNQAGCHDFSDKGAPGVFF